ncbi:MAG: TIGR03621 family F420-dependent LLM class oxidoreductase [Thermomicrobiales bacterium]
MAIPHHPFRFGVVNDARVDPDGWIDHVRRVEVLGFSTFLIRDHILPDFFGPQLAPLAALAIAAAVTERLHVGTLVFSNDFRHPAFLAKEAATLDALSGGRFELGIGAGWLASEYEAAGLNLDRAGARIDRLEESLEILSRLLGGECLTFGGRQYSVKNLENFPRSAHPSGPPLLVGGGKPRMLRLAGRYADIVSILTTSVSTGVVENTPDERMPAEVERKLAWIREGAGDRYSEIELSLIPTIVLTDDRRQAAADLIEERGWNGMEIDDVLAMPSIFIGTLDDIVREMRARRDQYGFSYYVFSDALLETVAPIVAELAGE